ncbi:hypothetical protein BV898_19786 [Hypsibius exemplaris]|uniref:Uncharacterized protein n=1 Tax=Hypsibius exemplaris TaxID=2072580 RepID=A0A9X6RPY9_HYPEX|nr:hypothetical protein BV898_19786 [Hypsibius exemplaris]
MRIPDRNCDRLAFRQLADAWAVSTGWYCSVLRSVIGTRVHAARPPRGTANEELFYGRICHGARIPPAAVVSGELLERLEGTLSSDHLSRSKLQGVSERTPAVAMTLFETVSLLSRV